LGWLPEGYQLPFKSPHNSLYHQPYSQVQFESNVYSVPADRVQKKLVVKAYALRLDILDDQAVIASHSRCYGHKQEICNPLHYLPLLEQRPGAFEYAKPIRRWRKAWPAVYEQLLEHLRTVEEQGDAVRHFVKVLELSFQHLFSVLEGDNP